MQNFEQNFEIDFSLLIKIVERKDGLPTFKSFRFITLFIVIYGYSHQPTAKLCHKVLLRRAIFWDVATTQAKPSSLPKDPSAPL